MTIETEAQLRQIYGSANERAVKKQLASLDNHCRRFLELSPFVVVSTFDRQGNVDASPKGGSPGFVRVYDDSTILIPDASGNNRLDSMTNILQTQRCGLLFLIPGVDETLRINGEASLHDEAKWLAIFGREKGKVKLVTRVTVREAYLHCAKAFMRSRLWDTSSHISRTELPTMGQMLKDQIGDGGRAETQEEMVERYSRQILGDT